MVVSEHLILIPCYFGCTSRTSLIMGILMAKKILVRLGSIIIFTNIAQKIKDEIKIFSLVIGNE